MAGFDRADTAVLQRSQAILLMPDFEGMPVALLKAMAARVVAVVRAIESDIVSSALPRLSYTPTRWALRFTSRGPSFAEPTPLSATPLEPGASAAVA